MPRPEQYETKALGTRWRVRVRNPDPPKGKAGYTSVTYATLPEAERFCRDVADRGVAWALAEHNRDRAEKAEPTLDDWAQVHFASLTKAGEESIRRYRRIYDTTWSPLLGHMRLSAIERTDVAQALTKVTGADKTVRNKWAVLTHMFKLAALDGKIDRSPALGVHPGRRTEHQTEEHRFLTQPEFYAILDATPQHWKPLVWMLAGTGIRWGEAAALTVGDVDLQTQVVRITKAEKRDPGHPGSTIVGPPKTKKGRRTISLPNEVLEAVTPLTQGRRRGDRLFLPPGGGPLRHRTFYRDIWQRQCLGLDSRGDREPAPTVAEPYPRVHDLRHSHVAWLIAQGRPLPFIQSRLGHEQISTTIDVYGHLTPDLQQQAADAAAVMFARPLELG